MASSKAKQPPAIHQKKTPELAGAVCDQSLFTAFKKLRTNEGSCVEKTEDQSQVPLKHKPEAHTAGDQDRVQPDKDSDDWSESLRNFCFCDKRALRKKGTARLKSMCHYHRLRLRKDNASASCKSSLNLAHAARAYKPLLREGCLKLTENKKTTQVMRSTRFTFKATKASDIKVKDLHSSRITSPISVIKLNNSPTKDASQKTSAVPNPSKTMNKKAVASPQPVFAAAASGSLPSFSSVVPQASATSPFNEQDVMPHFDRYRGNSNSRHHNPVSNQGSASESSQPSVPGSDAAAAASAVPSRVDLAVDRSCSQEARLDESEFNVNELAAYLDNYLYLPRDMSSMAKMMYA